MDNSDNVGPLVRDHRKVQFGFEPIPNLVGVRTLEEEMIMRVRPVVTKATGKIWISFLETKFVMRLNTLFHGDPKSESMSRDILREPNHMVPVNVRIIGVDRHPNIMDRKMSKTTIPFPPEEPIRDGGREHRGDDQRGDGWESSRIWGQIQLPL